jgi:thymidine kinase
MIIEIKGIMIGCANKSETMKSGKTFEYCEVLIETKEEKNNVFMVKAKTNDPLITGRIGDEIKAGCFLNSREWNGKYFYDLKLAKMEVISSPVGTVDGDEVAEQIAQEADKAFEGESEQLPF